MLLGRTRAAGAVLAAVALLCPRPASAGDTVIVSGADLPAYKAVEQSFSAALGGPSTSVTLTDADAIKGAGLVFAIGPEAARALAASHTSALQLVALVPNSEKTGLDARVPMVPMFVPAARQLKAFKAVLPSLKNLGVIYDPSLSKALVADCEAAAVSASITVVKSPVADRAAVASAARTLLPWVDALWLIPDKTVISAETFKFLVETSIGAKVPLLGFSEGMARAGALVSVEAGYPEIGKHAAAAARRALAGAAPAPEAPEGTLFLNAKSAALLGAQLPKAARDGAAKVFE